MSTPRIKKIEELQARLARLQAEQRATEARARAAATKASRAQDTRRKILCGAFLIDQLGMQRMAELSVQGQRLDAWLTRDDDRALFNLHPLASASPADTSPPGSSSAASAAPHVDGGSP